MNGKDIKAVLLDMGDTILNYGKVDVNRAFGEAAERSYEFLQSLNQPVGSFKKYMSRNLFAIKFRCIIAHFTGRDFDSLKLMQKIGKKHGLTLTQDQWEHVSWLWYDSIGRLAKVEDDICQTFTKLKEMGLKLGIVSNTFVNGVTLTKHFKDLNLWHFFDEVVFSYTVPHRKPGKRIFHYASELINVKPENILFVGDRIDADVKGSTAVGMTAVLKNAYTNEGKKAPAGIRRIDYLSELPDIIKSYKLAQ